MDRSVDDGSRPFAYIEHMPFIEPVPPEEATGVTKREYEAAIRRAGRIWNVVAAMSLNGPAMRDSLRLYRTLMFDDSPLSRAQREMIAVVTSQANDCHY